MHNSNRNGVPKNSNKNTSEQFHIQCFFNKTLNHNQSKSINVRFYGIQDVCSQGRFKYFWRPVEPNLGYYHTKHDPPAHHKLIRHKYLRTKNIINQLKLYLMPGCVNSPVRAHSQNPVNSPACAHSHAPVDSLAQPPSHALVNSQVRSHSHAPVNSLLCMHSRAPDNTRQKPHSTIIMARTKYGPIRA